jgi:hypothetical protein
VRIGDTVRVRIDEFTRRPLLVAEVHPDGSVSGLIACVAGDYLCPAFRSWESGDGARITGHPSKVQPFGYGELLKPGAGLGEWVTR